jgi:predicted transcriptional regulator
VTEDIIKILEKEDELSIMAISKEADTQWRTALKSLNFLSNIGIVKERKGKKTNKEERLFILRDKEMK